MNPITRRKLVLGGSGVVLAGLALDGVLRARRAAPRPVGPAPAPPGSLCVGSSSPSARAAAGPPRDPLHVERLARFVDPLPLPPRLSPLQARPDPDVPGASIRAYRVAMRAAEIRVHRDLPPTTMWGYEGSVPGPTIETRSGEPLIVEWVNELPRAHLFAIDHTLHGAGADRPDVRAVVHVHGGRTPAAADGHPESWYPPGKSAVHRYPNRQDAAMLWYHDHAMGIERLNQYAGLFGVFLVRDDLEDSLGLPADEREIPLVLCDRLFDADGSLRYPTSDDPDAPWVEDVFGDAHLVNGKLFPYLDAAPARYRLRIVNASNARVYYLSLSTGSNAVPLHVVGNDQGLLGAPAVVARITLAPAERVDVVVDFGDAAGQTLTLRSQAFDLMQVRVRKGPRDASRPLPAVLRSVARPPESEAVATRTLTLRDDRDPRTGRPVMLLNGSYWRDPVTERPVLGTTEIWELVNPTEEMHPIHLHLVRFQILDRQVFDADGFLLNGVVRRMGAPRPPDPIEAGWKDTVRAEPGLITRILVRVEGFVGSYVWHCHVLEHAANEMMRPFEVV